MESVPLVALMQSLVLLRKQPAAALALAVSLLWTIPQTSEASLGAKPSERLRPVRRESSAQPEELRERPSRPKFLAGLFGVHRESSPSLSKSRLPVRQVRTTAYTHEEADHQAYGRSTAIGTILRSTRTYNSAAADWSRFPLGTKFQIVGEPTVYVIDDCGGALYGTNTIDIYRPSLSAMYAWGTRFVQIKILGL